MNGTARLYHWVQVCEVDGLIVESVIIPSFDADICKCRIEKTDGGNPELEG